MKNLNKKLIFGASLALALSVSNLTAFGQGNGNRNGNQNNNSNSNCLPVVSATFASNGLSVTANSTKNLSNVVLLYCDGAHQKFDNLTGFSSTFSGTGSNTDKKIQGVWIKSGCNQSGDGPGYGTFVANPDANVCSVTPPPPAGCYVFDVVNYLPGKRYDGSDVVALRANPDKAKGEPQRSDASTNDENVNFVALGFGGQITVVFEHPVKNGPGADIKVWETTFSPSTGNCATYPESIIAFASQDGCSWKYIGGGCQDVELDLSTGGLNWAQFIRLVDVSPKAAFASVGHIADGYDVDGVECLNGFESNPITQNFDCQFATSVVDYTPGVGKILPLPLEDRRNPERALGAPQRIDSQNFVSLGFGGSLILGFSCVIFDKPGNDIEIVETSFGQQSCNSYPEKAIIEGSLDMQNWVNLGEICLDGFIDLNGKGPIQFLKITDNSNPASFSNSNTSDGFDVDGVVVIQPGCASAGRLMNTAMATTAKTEVKLMPNPAQNFFTLEFINGIEENNATITIVNTVGQVIVNERLNVEANTPVNHTFNIETFATGIYFVQVKVGNETNTFKLIKN